MTERHPPTPSSPAAARRASPVPAAARGSHLFCVSFYVPPKLRRRGNCLYYYSIKTRQSFRPELRLEIHKVFPAPAASSDTILPRKSLSTFYGIVVLRPRHPLKGRAMRMSSVRSRRHTWGGVSAGALYMDCFFRPQTREYSRLSYPIFTTSLLLLPRRSIMTSNYAGGCSA